MRKFALVAVLLLGMASVALADAIPTMVGATTPTRWTKTVYNDHTAAITSGLIVIWDEDDSDINNLFQSGASGYPYVILADTTADDPYTAGVMLTDSCAAGAMCEIVVFGPAYVLSYDASDPVTVDTLVGTSASQAGYAGDFAGGNDDTAALGIAMTAGSGVDGAPITVFVNVSHHHDGTE